MRLGCLCIVLTPTANELLNATGSAVSTLLVLLATVATGVGRVSLGIAWTCLVAMATFSRLDVSDVDSLNQIQYKV